MMEVKIASDWKEVLSEEFEKDYFKKLVDFVKQEYQTSTCYPPGKDIFTAFDACSFKDLKVIILGQDPYHGPGQAHGLSFSVPEGIKHPPSLRNIFQEYHTDLGFEIPKSGDLTAWAKQGVLLLNATLTVRVGEAGSHQKQGWEEFTEAVIQQISEKKDGIVFILWGSFAQKKAKVIKDDKHFLIQSPHPSPLSSYRGFFGSKPFSKTNEFLSEKGIKKIDWKLS